MLLKKISNRIRLMCDRYNPFTLAKNRIRYSNWYYHQFPHLKEYERLTQGADIICLGSTPAKNALDFSNIKSVKGYNLAVCPETIFYDFQILKNYHSYLKTGGTVLFVVCPFTFLKDYYRNEYGSTSYLNIRYYPILHRAMIDTFDYSLYHKWVENPLILGFDAWKRLIRDWKPIEEVTNNSNTIEESTKLCQTRVKNWMREFHLQDLNPENIPIDTENAIKNNIRLFQVMKCFIEERGYKATIIVPPFPKEMIDLMPLELVQHTLFEPIIKTGLPFVSYYNDKNWLSRDFYYHGFLLNKMGRDLFTQTVLSNISLE